MKVSVLRSNGEARHGAHAFRSRSPLRLLPPLPGRHAPPRRTSSANTHVKRPAGMLVSWLPCYAEKGRAGGARRSSTWSEAGRGEVAKCAGGSKSGRGASRTRYRTCRLVQPVSAPPGMAVSPLLLCERGVCVWVGVCPRLCAGTFGEDLAGRGTRAASYSPYLVQARLFTVTALPQQQSPAPSHLVDNGSPRVAPKPRAHAHERTQQGQ